MNKSELISEVAAKSGLSKNDVTTVLDMLSETLEDAVMNKNDTVTLPGVGIFKRKDVPARTGRNPRTGESVSIPAKSKLAFKQSSSFGK